MAIYTELPIYKSTYDLLLEFNKIMPNLSRDCRYSIGDEVRKKIMDVIILIYKAGNRAKRLDLIADMKELIVEIQVSLRLMCDMRYLSQKQYLRFVEQTADIFKQLAQWMKNEQLKRDIKVAGE